MNRLRLLREEAGWSQETLGKKLQVQKAAVSKYETGRSALTADLILQLCEIFHCSADYLLGRAAPRSCQSCPAAAKQGEQIIQKAFEHTGMLTDDGLLLPGSEAVLQEFLAANAGILRRLIQNTNEKK